MKPSDHAEAALAAAALRFRRLPWRVGVRVFWAVFLLSLTGGVAIGLNAFLATQQAYRRDAGILAEAVARSVERPLSRAAEYGVPLSQLPDGEKFLASLLGNSPALARIEIRDARGKTLFEAEDDTRMSTAFMIARAPVKGKTEMAGSVLATASLNAAAEPFVAIAELALAFAAGIAVLTGAAAGLLTSRMIARPAMRAAEAMKRVGNGEVALRVPVDRAAELTDFWTAFRARARRIGDRWTALAAYAAELEASDYENRNQIAIAMLVASLRERYTLPFVLPPDAQGSSPEGNT